MNSNRLIIATSLCLGAFCAVAQHKENTKWTWSGWGGGGFFWSAAWDPANADVLYMGGDVIGVYKSTDRGRSWRIINNGIQDYGVYTLAVAKSNPKVVYAMTQNGIARSDNGGEEWRRLAESMNAAKRISIQRGGTVRGIAIDPKNAKVVYAGSGRGEAFKSTDGGETWHKLDFLSAMPKDNEGGPDAPSGRGFLWMRYAAAANDWQPHGRVEKHLAAPQDWSAYDRMTARFLAPAGANGLTAALVLQTGDGWVWQQSPLTALKPGEWVEIPWDISDVKELDKVRMVHLVVRANGNAVEGDIGIDDVRLFNSKDKKELVIGDWERPGDLDGWRKTNANDGRFAKSAFSSLAPAPAITAPIATVAVAETDPNLVFIGHRKLGLFRSADAGKTWTRPDTPAEAAHVAIHAKDAKIIYGAFGKDGVWKSTDAGVTWAKLEGFNPSGHAARELAVDPRDPDVIHSISTGNWSGMYGLSTDGGKTWKHGRKWSRDAESNATRSDETKGGGDLSTPTNLAMSPSNPDCLFISANWVNIMTTDRGTTWLQRDTGADITCFHDLRFAGNSIFATAMDEGLFRSDDNGATWRCLAPHGYQEGLSGHQWRVHAHKQPNGAFHIVSTVSPWRAAKEYPNRLLVSRDSGKTFANATGLPDALPKKNVMWGEGYARALAADPKNPMTMYLGIDGDDGGGVFKSTDGGLTWNRLPNQPGSRRMFYGIAVDPTDSNRIYWGSCGDNGGVWISPDAGDSWQRAKLDDAWIFNVETSAKGNVYAGGANLWRSTDKGKTWQKLTNFSSGSVVGIATDPADENRFWISRATWGSGSDGDVLRTDDGGKTWTDVAGDIPYKKPLILRYNAAAKELWAAGVGAYRVSQDPNGPAIRDAKKRGAETLAALAAAATLVTRANTLAPGQDAKVEPLAFGRKSAFLMMFDDACPTHVRNAIPALQKANLPGTFYIIPEKGEYKAQKDFWENKAAKMPQVILGNHSLTHAGFKDQANLDDELSKANAVILRSAPGKPKRLISFALPGGVKHTPAPTAEDLKRHNLVDRPAFGGHGAGVHYHNAAHVLTDIDKATASGSTAWIIFHGVGGDWISFAMGEFNKLLDGLEERKNDVWVTDPVSLHKYQTEAKTAKVLRKTVGRNLTVELTSDADPALYDQPLTLSVRVPANWKKVNVTQAGKTTPADVTDAVASFEALPNAGPVTLAPAN